jgi:hypothetical protein
MFGQTKMITSEERPIFTPKLRPLDEDEALVMAAEDLERSLLQPSEEKSLDQIMSDQPLSDQMTSDPLVDVVLIVTTRACKWKKTVVKKSPRVTKTDLMPVAKRTRSHSNARSRK